MAHVNGPIYLIADIHSNYPALQSVLAEIPTDSLILCAGDITGYYVNPTEVCELLRGRNVHCILGNHDKYIIGSLNYPTGREGKYRVLSSRTALSAKQLKWLSTLPDIISIEIDFPCSNKKNIVIDIAHGSPRNVEEYLYPDTDICFLDDYPADVLILGHTHHPMVREARNTLIVNPGSVGQARDRIPGACYAVLDVVKNMVEFHRVSYSVSEYQGLLESCDVHSEMINILSREK